LNLFFDLDGTLTDPKDGIVRCINYSLAKFGLPECEPSSIERFIGPPLKSTFRTLLNTEDEATLLQAIAWYRERYSSKGYRENYVYDGIPELLQGCKESGHNLYIATFKRQDFAERIMVHFDLATYFCGIYGCTTNQTKAELLGHIIHERGLSASDCMMIGDRVHDVDSGRENNMSTAGVLWGYGSLDELTTAIPDHIAKSPSDLLTIVRGLC
jgi:phosphoglycolate phosphatase